MACSSPSRISPAGLWRPCSLSSGATRPARPGRVVSPAALYSRNSCSPQLVPGQHRCAELLSQTREECESLELELAALQGVIVEISAQLAAACSTPGRSPRGSRGLSVGTSMRSTASGSASSRSVSTSISATVCSVFSSDPAEAAAAQGRHAAAPVGARHRRPSGPAARQPGGRQACERLLQELEAASQHCRRAIGHTASLVHSLEAQASDMWDSRVHSSRSGQCQAMLWRQLEDQVAENRGICRRARALVAEALHCTNKTTAGCWQDVAPEPVASCTKWGLQPGAEWGLQPGADCRQQPTASGGASTSVAVPAGIFHGATVDAVNATMP